MSSTAASVRDPVFFMHHAYIDRIYSQWQAAGGGASFAGTHGGVTVTDQTPMAPFARTAGTVLNGISQCTTYTNGGGSTRMAVLDPVVRPAETLSGGNDCLYPRMRRDEKKSLQVAVARKKVADPVAYQTELKAALKECDSCKYAAEKLGMSPTNVEAFVRNVAIIKLQNGVDISEPEVVDEDPAMVQMMAQEEEDALGNDDEASLKEGKKSEDASNTVSTY